MDARLSDLEEAVRAAAVTRDVVVEPGAMAALPALVDRHFGRTPLLVVADANTQLAAGQRAWDALYDHNIAAEHIVLPSESRLKPDASLARNLAQRLGASGAIPVAVGSGVINDLVKYAAALVDRPYICVATAASMDGYAASGAALLDAGFKRTFACPPPLAVLADLNILVAAPPQMAAWGYGDLAGKLVAGADWLLADSLGEDELNPAPFAMVQDNIRAWLADPDGVRRHDPRALRALFDGLLISGFAMQAHGNSRPASGSDHQFAHLWEMEEVAVGGVPVSHGACVGVGCLSMLAAYEWLLRQDFSRIVPAELAARVPTPATLRAEVAASFPLAFMAANAEVEAVAKAAGPQVVETRLRRLQANWSQISERLRQSLPEAKTVRRWLNSAGAPSSTEAIGISGAKHARDYKRARLIRRRFTGLDVLHELGWLDAMVGDLFGASGFWRGSRAVA